MKRLAMLLAASMPAICANLLTNGSFEQPNLTGNTTIHVYDAGSAAINGWTVVPFAPADVSILRSDFTNDKLSFLPQSGDQSLDLTGDFPGEAAGVSQNVTLTIGRPYELTFWIGNQDNSVSDYELDSTASLTINGHFISFYTNGDNTPGALNWKEFTYDFTATQASNSIQFNNMTLSFDREIGLDSVDLEDLIAQTTTPEPWTLWLAAAGLLAIRFVRPLRSSGRV
jgi:hypothetical protein